MSPNAELKITAGHALAIFHANFKYQIVQMVDQNLILASQTQSLIFNSAEIHNYDTCIYHSLGFSSSVEPGYETNQKSILRTFGHSNDPSV